MGSGASKEQTEVFTSDKQLWCGVCIQQFETPVKLKCGHKVCGPDSGRDCVQKAIEKGNCHVHSCGVKLPREDVELESANDMSEYDKVFRTETAKVDAQKDSPSTSKEAAHDKPAILKSGDRGFTLVDSVQGNGLKKILIIGKTGTGKSSLCNVVAGLDPNSNSFVVSEKPEACTQTTQFGNVRFDGDKERPVTVIDTIGFDDPENDTDAIIISDLVFKLQNKCDYVNLFAIAVNGQNPRLDGSLVGMIRIFEEMFGEKFWKQAILVFTRLPMDKKSRDRRTKNGGADEKVASDYLKCVQKKFPKAKNLKFLLMDSCYEKEDDEEKTAFTKAMDDLWSILQSCPPLPTEFVRKVETENFKLKKAIQDREKELLRVVEDSEKKSAAMELRHQKELQKIKSEMRKDHEAQIAKLRSDRKQIEQSFEKKETDLRLQLDLKLSQKQQEQDQFRPLCKINYNRKATRIKNCASRLRN